MAMNRKTELKIPLDTCINQNSLNENILNEIEMIIAKLPNVRTDINYIIILKVHLTSIFL